MKINFHDEKTVPKLSFECNLVNLVSSVTTLWYDCHDTHCKHCKPDCLKIDIDSMIRASILYCVFELLFDELIGRSWCWTTRSVWKLGMLVSVGRDSTCSLLLVLLLAVCLSFSASITQNIECIDLQYYPVLVIVTTTIAIPIHPDRSCPQLTVLSIASLLGETIYLHIWRLYNSSASQPLQWWVWLNFLGQVWPNTIWT